MFTNGRGLIQFFAAHLGDESGPHRQAGREADAAGLLSLLIGLSMAILLEQTTPGEAMEVLDRHLERLSA